MTLLVLDLRLPAIEAVHSEHDLWRALLKLGPQLVMYMMSFLTLGIFWVGQQTQLNHLARSERSLSWIHILFLFAVSITPYSTKLLAEFPAYRIALLAYWVNILLLGIALYLSWLCALEKGLVKPDLPAGSYDRHQAPHRDGAEFVCVRRFALRFQHLLEHRVHRAGAAQLCDCAADSGAGENLK